MKRIPLSAIIIFWVCLGFSQEVVVKNYKYRLVTTELSPKQAIQQARREALAACVQENLGTQVMNFTRLEKQQHDRKYMEKFNDFTQLVSNGYVRRFVVKDTVSTYDEKTLSLETRITLDITLYKPESDNPLGLYVATDKTTYNSGNKAMLTYSLEKTGYVYLFDLNYRNEFCLLYETKNPVPDNSTMVFPEENMRFTLTMAKEDKNDYEFGSFLVLATVKPVNFGVPAVVDNDYTCSYLDFTGFFSIISGIKKDYSIMYLPYSIE
jgi:hypothetical protein